MGRACTVCQRADLEAINTALVGLKGAVPPPLTRLVDQVGSATRKDAQLAAGVCDPRQRAQLLALAGINAHLAEMLTAQVSRYRRQRGPYRSRRAVAAAFGLGKDSLGRHWLHWPLEARQGGQEAYSRRQLERVLATSRQDLDDLLSRLDASREA